MRDDGISRMSSKHRYTHSISPLGYLTKYLSTRVRLPQKAICDGLLADCAIDSIAEPEVRAAVDASVAANPQSRAITDVGSVNTAVGGDAEFEHFQFLVRDYGDYAVHRYV